MSFKPYHYAHVNEFIRFYAARLGNIRVVDLLDKGIKSEEEARIFCDFIPILLDQRAVDEESSESFPVDIGSAVISDLHYEAGTFVCDAGYESIWDEMIDRL